MSNPLGGQGMVGLQISSFKVLAAAVVTALLALLTTSATSAVDPAPHAIWDEDVPSYLVANRSLTTGFAALADSQNEVTPRSIACIGNGSSGPRVKVIYAYKAGDQNRLFELRDYFKNMAKRVNGVFYQSSVGSATPQKVRFATNSNCELNISVLKLRDPVTGARGEFAEIVNQARAAGFTNTDRKYLIEMDLEPATNAQCGSGWAGFNTQDTSLDYNNRNNVGYAGFAVVGRACWNSAEAHEIVHMLGAVSDITPHSTGGGHCNDDHEVMCYADGGPFSDLQVVCPIENNWFLDCNNDDYYNNNQGYPVVRPVPGYEPPYLTNHWNVALSRYLTNPAEYPISH